MTRRFVRFLSAFALGLGLGAASATAQGFVDAPVEAEVLQGWVLPNGQRVTALRLTLDPGWKTYWRSPGDAGIPPAFDWSRARNVGDIRITWPTPSVYTVNGMRSIGYTDTLVIPMHVTPRRADKPVRLRATMSLGLCADICVPYTLDFDQMLDAPDARPTPAIVAALADAPFAADEAGVRAATCRITPTEQGLRIEARVTLPHTGGTETVVIEPGTPGVWVSEAETSRTGDTLVAVSELIHTSGKGAFSVNRSQVRITILGGKYAVDVRGCTAA